MSAPSSKREKRNGTTTTPCQKSTSCRATIPRTKAVLKSIRIMMDTQSNSQSIKQSPNSIKGQKSVYSPGSTPLRSSKMCSKDNTGLLGSRCSTSTFWSLSMQWGQCQARRTATLSKIFVKLSSSFFSGRWAKWSLGIGNISISGLVEITSSRRRWWQNYIFKKALMTKLRYHTEVDKLVVWS